MRAERFRKTLMIGVVLAALMLPGLAACSSVSESSGAINTNTARSEDRAAMEETAKPGTAGKVNGELVSANTRFGFKLFSEVAASNARKNVFISPSSVAFALAMAYNGAAGETRKAMSRALELGDMGLEEVNRANRELKSALEKADPKVQLQIANSLWGRKEVSFRPDFLERNREFYGAEVSALDFNDPSAPATINDWVSRNTNGKIERIVDQINQDAILFLINAIYFKGRWTVEFKKENTKEQSFTLADGSQKKHPMMSQSGKYDYFEGEGFQAVSLPYGDRRLSMYIFLPAKGSTLAEFQKSLIPENWERWMEEFERTEGDIVVPRFRVEFEVELKDALKALGMGLAFDHDRADFSGMVQNGEQVAINRVKHKTFAEVNEEGTEAAAVTSAEVTVTSVQIPRERFRMVVDRPFFCAIRDNDTGAVIFMGAINDPQ
ncbi:MAG TPA: serpin family protein [Blastocatellia bacterium]|nr:serpin family protein [Blastocatellia bacterium]